jgi:uncharacterized membrane protein YoaK (UPF0700 family)
MIKTPAFLFSRPPAGQPSRSAIRLRDSLVVVLALTTGALDVVSYLRLGKVFSSVMTGNLALLGVSAAQRTPDLALNAGLALAGYGLGVLAGGAFAGTPERDQPAWPRAATITLVVELLVLAGFSAGWLAEGGHPSGGPRLVLLALAAAAMGIQATAIRRLGRMSTTYLTSTLTGLLQALALRRWPSQWQRSTGVLLALVVGAVLGGLAAEQAPATVPAALGVPLAVVLACTLPAAGRRRPGAD